MTRARATSSKPFSACDVLLLLSDFKPMSLPTSKGWKPPVHRAVRTGSWMQGGYVTTSLGCIGNRVYTGLGDDEFYTAIPGPKLAPLLDKLATIVTANRELEGYHRLRMSGNSPA